MDKINNLSTGEKLIAGGGILMFIASFFDWWHVSIEGFGGGGTNGWDAPASIWSILAILISIALAAAVIAIRLGNVNAPNLAENLTWGKVLAGGAAAVVVLMLLKAWRILAVDAGGFGIGFWLALIATIAIAAGGLLAYREEEAGVVRGR